jgi:hypothetical protein
MGRYVSPSPLPLSLFRSFLARERGKEVRVVGSYQTNPSESQVE